MFYSCEELREVKLLHLINFTHLLTYLTARWKDIRFGPIRHAGAWNRITCTTRASTVS